MKEARKVHTVSKSEVSQHRGASLSEPNGLECEPGAWVPGQVP